jgi:hypothetical protein
MGTREIIRETLPWRRAAPEEFGAGIILGAIFDILSGFSVICRERLGILSSHNFTPL